MDGSWQGMEKRKKNPVYFQQVQQEHELNDDDTSN
jgi:hypothetical protein